MPGDIDIVTLVGQRVRVTRLADDAQSEHFTLNSAVGPTAVLAPAGARAQLLAVKLMPGELIELACARPNGVARMITRVERWATDSRLLVVINPERLEHHQQRDSHRVEARLGLRLVWLREGTVVFANGTTLNVSAGGCAADVGGNRPEAGLEVVAVLDLGPPPPLTMVAKVIAIDEPIVGGLRMAFTQVAGVDRDRIGKQVQRIEMQRPRSKSR